MIATLLALTPLGVAPQVTLTLAAEAQVRGTEIRVGDVAVLDGDAELVAKLADAHLGYAPSPGFNRLLQGWRLEQNLERDHPGVDIVLAGAANCRVWPATALVTAAALEAAARELLDPALASGDATAALATSLRDIEVPAGQTPPVVRPAADTVDLRAGSLRVPVRIDVDGEPYRTVWTQWNVERWEILPVLVRDVPAGAAIDFSMIENRRVQARTQGVGAPLPAGLVVGSIAARNLALGSIVTERDIQRPMIIREGDRIYLAIRKGPVVAKVPAVAGADGAFGDRIRIKTHSARELMAVVVARDLVELDLTAGS